MWFIFNISIIKLWIFSELYLINLSPFLSLFLPSFNLQVLRVGIEENKHVKCPKLNLLVSNHRMESHILKIDSRRTLLLWLLLLYNQHFWEGKTRWLLMSSWNEVDWHILFLFFFFLHVMFSFPGGILVITIQRCSEKD